MKIRTGFVTNSSSSSFVVVLKNPQVDLKTKLNSIFAVCENHPLKLLVNDIVKRLLSEINSCEKYDLKNIKRLVYNYCDDGENCEYAQMLLKYGNLSVGSFSSEGDEVEAFLCMNDLNYEDEDILIEHDGGY